MKAREHLDKAQTLLEVVHYSDEAGRAAYLAGFHAAQALISERTGRISRTHAGVNAQFNLLTKDDPRVDAALRGFLPRTFRLKATADYMAGPDAVVSQEQAEAAIDTATRFINCVVELLASQQDIR